MRFLSSYLTRILAGVFLIFVTVGAVHADIPNWRVYNEQDVCAASGYYSNKERCACIQNEKRPKPFEKCRKDGPDCQPGLYCSVDKKCENDKRGVGIRIQEEKWNKHPCKDVGYKADSKKQMKSY